MVLIIVLTIFMNWVSTDIFFGVTVVQKQKKTSKINGSRAFRQLRQMAERWRNGGTTFLFMVHFSFLNCQIIQKYGVNMVETVFSMCYNEKEKYHKGGKKW